MDGNAEILLVRDDGAVILQVRDNKPGITNPGLISSFGGHIEAGETPHEAAVREINEETNLNLDHKQLEFYRKCRKTKAVHGEDWDVYYYVVKDASEEGMEVYEGEGFTVIHDKQELAEAKTTVLLKQVLNDYFDGFRSFLFKPDLPNDTFESLLADYYAQITANKEPAAGDKIALACTGLVAAGKSTVTAPLAEMIGAATASSDKIRQLFFTSGYNFKRLRPFIFRLLDRLVQDNYHIFLDFNASTNIGILDKLKADGYRIFVVYANPPEEFIKQKILTGNMRHELSFFPKDEFLYESMLGWRDDHFAKLPELKQKHGIWQEVDTSRSDLPEVMAQMMAWFKDETKQ